MNKVDLDKLVVTNNEERKRYEIDLGGAYAYVEYILAKNLIVLSHTEVPPAFEGQGVANKVIRAALEDARDRGLPVNPLCPFVAAFIARHPEYLEIVPPGLRR